MDRSGRTILQKLYVLPKPHGLSVNKSQVTQGVGIITSFEKKRIRSRFSCEIARAPGNARFSPMSGNLSPLLTSFISPQCGLE